MSSPSRTVRAAGKHRWETRRCALPIATSPPRGDTPPQRHYRWPGRPGEPSWLSHAPESRALVGIARLIMGSLSQHPGDPVCSSCCHYASSASGITGRVHLTSRQHLWRARCVTKGARRVRRRGLRRPPGESPVWRRRSIPTRPHKAHEFGCHKPRRHTDDLIDLVTRQQPELPLGATPRDQIRGAGQDRSWSHIYSYRCQLASVACSFGRLITNQPYTRGQDVLLIHASDSPDRSVRIPDAFGRFRALGHASESRTPECPTPRPFVLDDIQAWTRPTFGAKHLAPAPRSSERGGPGRGPLSHTLSCRTRSAHRDGQPRIPHEAYLYRIRRCGDGQGTQHHVRMVPNSNLSRLDAT